MTPEQKIKWLIVQRASEFNENAEPPYYPCDNIDEAYDNLVANDLHWDAKEEVRCSGYETGIECEYSRHYESKSLAEKLPDESWVGWTYYYGGGKHGDPGSIEWISKAYDLNCFEEEVIVTKRTFSKKVS